MKKAIIMSFFACVLFSCDSDSVNECPVAPYKTHKWNIDIVGTDYIIEKCEFCNRHRRNVYDSDYYIYEDMKTSSLNIEIPKKAVDK